MEQLLKKHREVYSRKNNSYSSLKITTYHFDKYMDNINKSSEYREAAALKNVYENCDIVVRPYELVVGNYFANEITGFHIGCGTYINSYSIEKFIEQEKMTDKEKEQFFKKIEQIRSKKFLNYYEEGFEKYRNNMFNVEEENGIITTSASSTFFGGHMVLDYEELINRGLSSYAEEIRKYRKTVSTENPEFYDAMENVLQGFMTIIRRTADKSLELSMQCYGMERENMLSLERDLRHIVTEKPQSFRQALQLVWLVHICGDSDTFGRFDKYLYPFYKKDIETGVITKDLASLLIQSLMIKIDERNSIQNMTIGGLYENGEPSYNELTLLVLKSTVAMGFKGPNLSMRVNKFISEEIWGEIVDCLGTGQGLPALYNDEVMIKQLLDLGIESNEANDFCLAGCSQIMIPGRSQFVNDIGIMNIAKILELTIYNGQDRAMTGLNSGLKTGEITEFHSFEKFFEAYKKQLSYFAKVEAQVNNKIVRSLKDTEGYTLRSLFTRDCLEKGRGVFWGGARYNNIQLECIGITNAADSLAAIKKIVFEDKKITFEELRNILKSNFNERDDIRAYLKNSVPKFGNDDDYVDNIRTDITQYLFNELRKQKSIIEGIYIPGEVIFTTHEFAGAATGATPDGRFAKEVLADSAGAMQGMDKNGPTALMKSVLKIPVNKISTSIVLNIKFIKSFWSRDKEKITALLKAFIFAGGQQLQINVCDNEVLKKAYENPENYQNLVVRVGGYSDYFTNLSKALQLEIIERSAIEI